MPKLRHLARLQSLPNFQQPEIELIAFTVNQQHRNMYLFPENKGVEIPDFRVPTPEVGIFGRYSKPLIPSCCLHRPTCHFNFSIRFLGRVSRAGRTSMTVEVALWAEDLLTGTCELCTKGSFVLVAVDEHGRPVPNQDSAAR